ncbi:unnamed protein product [Rotaria sp. Silwood2]|nr:unnamed protein product [Rotaria sp. Silwood2]
MGLNDRLVITLLTDRIYLTVTQALSMFLGCAPAESAGTGKTESIKDLANTIDLLCVVTNCGEVSTQVKSIQQALSLHVKQFFFGRDEIQLLSTVDIFVTIDPGYADRTELRESVKTLFRPVAVV